MPEYKAYSDEWLVDQYLRYGSVEEAIRQYKEYLPVSVATFHRKVASNGLVKSPGRHVSLTEALHFFREKAIAPGTPLESLYRQMPLRFKTSMASLHRIYNSIEQKVVRRDAAALIIKHPKKKEILVVQESSTDTRYGKKEGDWTVPMGFCRKKENDIESIARILQHEFSTKLAISGELSLGSKLTKNFFDQHITPAMYFDIVDVRVKVYSLSCPKELSDLAWCSSYRVNNHRFMDSTGFKNEENVRMGVVELLKVYENISDSAHGTPEYYTSSLNDAVLAI